MQLLFLQQLAVVASRVMNRTMPLDEIGSGASTPSGSQGSTASADVNIPAAQAQPKAEATSATAVFEFLNLVSNAHNRYSLGKKNWEIVVRYTPLKVLYTQCFTNVTSIQPRTRAIHFLHLQERQGFREPE